MGFAESFRPEWKSLDSKKRMQAIRRIKSYRKLKKIFARTDYEDLKYEIARKLKDKNLFKELLDRTYNTSLKYRIAKRLNDRDHLFQIALVHGSIIPEKEISSVILETVVEDEDLARILEGGGENYSLRLGCARSIKNRDLLGNVAKNSDDYTTKAICGVALKDIWLILSAINAYIPYQLSIHSYMPVSDKTYHFAVKEARELLDSCRENEPGIIRDVIQKTSNDSFKMGLLWDLPGDLMDIEVLQSLSEIKFKGFGTDAIRDMFLKIKLAGWKLDAKKNARECIECGGRGGSRANVDDWRDNYSDHGFYQCDKCGGSGKIPFVDVNCSKNGLDFTFHIKSPGYRGCFKDIDLNF